MSFPKHAAVPAAAGTVASGSGLFGEVHLFEEVGSVSDAVDYEKHVADVERDVAAESRIESDVAHGREPRAVEIHADQLAPAVEYRRTGVAARGVVVRKEADGNGRAAVDLHAPASVVLGGDDVAEPLRDVVIVNFRIVLFQNTFDSGVGLVIYPVGILIAAYLAVSRAA